MFNKKYKDEIMRLNISIEKLTKDNKDLTDRLEDSEQIRVQTNTRLMNLLTKYHHNIEYDNILAKIQSANKTLDNVNAEIAIQRSNLTHVESKLVQATNTHEAQTMGLYSQITPKYATEEYKDKIKAIRDERAEMLRNKTYYTVNYAWTCNDSTKEGKRLLEFFTKQTITAFNLSVDALIARISVSNIVKVKEHVNKLFNTLNGKLSENEVYLNEQYLNLVLKELDLKFELEVQRQRDKEEREYQKAIIREQELVDKEIAKRHETLLKERKKYEIQLNNGKDVADKIAEIDKAIENNEYRKEHTLAGYVYIISNPSLGKDVYKIGVTRRVEWEKRIDELNNASVPFRFSPNCILFSENAFALESALHREFNQYRVNKINLRKEYFHIPLKDIETVIKQKYDSSAIFDYDAVDECYIASCL